MVHQLLIGNTDYKHILTDGLIFLIINKNKSYIKMVSNKRNNPQDKKLFFVFILLPNSLFIIY